jgi:hypothetical protein
MRQQVRQRLGTRPLGTDGTGGGESLGEDGGPLLRRQVRRQAGQHPGAPVLVPDRAGGGEDLGENGWPLL